MRSLLNHAAVRATLLELAAANRPGWAPSRVSDNVLRAVECDVLRILSRIIEQHPSTGRTIKQVV